MSTKNQNKDPTIDPTKTTEQKKMSNPVKILEYIDIPRSPLPSYMPNILFSRSEFGVNTVLPWSNEDSFELSEIIKITKKKLMDTPIVKKTAKTKVVTVKDIKLWASKLTEDIAEDIESGKYDYLSQIEINEDNQKEIYNMKEFPMRWWIIVNLKKIFKNVTVTVLDNNDESLKGWYYIEHVDYPDGDYFIEYHPERYSFNCSFLMQGIPYEIEYCEDYDSQGIGCSSLEYELGGLSTNISMGGRYRYRCLMKKYNYPWLSELIRNMDKPSKNKKS